MQHSVQGQEMPARGNVPCGAASFFAYPHLSGKEKPIMKNKKNFAQSLRQQFREGMLLYAAANSRYPESLTLMRCYQDALEEE